jgi:methylenetetrahydrofolate dehydrogenase (NADP+) / methenyltetrahydrofolate cyclohydrolase
MMYHLIDGKACAHKLEASFKQKIEALEGRAPVLVVILVGDSPASKLYIKRKREACKRVGIISILKNFPATISEQSLLMEIDLLNRDRDVDALLIQLPLPSAISAQNICLAIDPKKDVDGFHPLNLGKLLMGDENALVACTPLGIIMLLQEEKISLEGAHVVVIGRSNIVGKPLAALLSQNREGLNATVTLAHSKTVDLAKLTKSADILIAAIGKPHVIKKEMVSPNTVVIDVGINRLLDPTSKSGYQIVGDVDFEEVKNVCSAITPVPGGVGPMTIAALLNNTLKCYSLR